jgi:glycosyltransferase involved in cell wall biosynthesis
LSEEKGIRTLVRAWGFLNRPPLLKVVGDGPLAPLVRSAGPHLQCLGRLPMTEAYDLIGGASALIFPSDCYETFGRVIAEAFAKGTPVIASRLGTSIEMVRPGRTGELFNPGDPLDLACRVNELTASPQRLLEMRPAARAEFEAKYHADANYQQLLNAYDRALRHRHPVPSAPAAAAYHQLGRWQPQRSAAG